MCGWVSWCSRFWCLYQQRNMQLHQAITNERLRRVYLPAQSLAFSCWSLVELSEYNIECRLFTVPTHTVLLSL